MPNFKVFTLISLVISTIALGSCVESDPASQGSSSASTPAWVLTSAPAGALSISEAKSSAKEGKQIVLRGRIGGRKEVITAGSPVFTVVDLAIPHCGENPDDACRTPWDYCCETPETITTNSATIQIVDESGQPITADLVSSGLKALDEIFVLGIVGPRPSEEILTVRASGVYRVRN